MSQTGSPLSLSNISKAYDRVQALAGLSFDVKPGQLFALFGPSSVGKTTTLRTIAGLVRPDTGTVTIAGRDTLRSGSKDSNHQARQNGNRLNHDSATKGGSLC